jgi:hypothetical protein
MVMENMILKRDHPLRIYTSHISAFRNQRRVSTVSARVTRLLVNVCDLLQNPCARTLGTLSHWQYSPPMEVHQLQGMT